MVSKKPGVGSPGSRSSQSSVPKPFLGKPHFCCVDEAAGGFRSIYKPWQFETYFSGSPFVCLLQAERTVV